MVNHISLEDKIKSLEKQQLRELISELIRKSQDCKKLIFIWLGDTEKVNEELIQEYWQYAEEIISEFNELGGGPEKEEDAYEWLEEISQLLITGSLSSEARQNFIDEAIFEYQKHNSIFEDQLMELFFEACKSDEDWEFLIQKLKEKPSEWDIKLI
ncbi:MAG: hypothetical protein ACTSUT_00800 [Promethearchaeota archaeon]